MGSASEASNARNLVDVLTHPRTGRPVIAFSEPEPAVRCAVDIERGIADAADRLTARQIENAQPSHGECYIRGCVAILAGVVGSAIRDEPIHYAQPRVVLLANNAYDATHVVT